MNTAYWKITVACILVLLGTDSLMAIPAFSRKYKTSCATCHIAFPKLTPFGESFRRNGYQFPDGGDAAATKEEPVSMGAEGNKRAFPDAIWPSTIPGSVPIGIVAELESVYGPKSDQKWDFGTLAGEVEVLMGGTLGEDISFYSEAEFADGEANIMRANVIFSNLFGGTTAKANLRVGKFEPGVFSFSNHRRISPAYGITANSLGDNQWSLEESQTGLELNGVIGEGRLGYNVGLVEGKGNLPNAQKDVYGHLTYKIGGMRLDGVVPGTETTTGPTQPWQDNSVTIGGFVYKGTATLDGSGMSLPNVKDGFTMAGGDVNIWYNRLNVIGALARQNDDRPMVATAGKANMTSLMAEASYIVYPWLIPLARFERSKVNVDPNAETKVIAVLQILVRANVRVAFEFNFANDTTDPVNPTKIAFEELATGVTIGF